MCRFADGFVARICARRVNCDEPLTYPPVSTGHIAQSGKLTSGNIVRPPIQAHFEPVFGTRSNGNGKLQGLEVTGVLIPKMAVTSVHAPVWRGHAGGFGQRQVSSIQGSGRRGDTGQAKNLARRQKQRNGASPQPRQLAEGKGTKASAAAKARWRNSDGFGRMKDAEASPSESRMPARAPVTNLWHAGRKMQAARG